MIGSMMMPKGMAMGRSLRTRMMRSPARKRKQKKTRRTSVVQTKRSLPGRSSHAAPRQHALLLPALP
jgi:hypothetical protein